MIVIVRHGNTFEAGEEPRRIGARTDLPLTAKGLQQADALGRCFADKDWRFSRIVTSPLLRTRQTAEAIAAHQALPVPIEPASFLREIDHGPDEGQTEQDVLARIGAEAIAAWDNQGIAPSGWSVDAAGRSAAWRAFLSESAAAPGPVLAVTSNGAARFALLSDPGLMRQSNGLASLKLSTGAYGIIEVTAEGGLRIAAWNERP